MAILRREGSLVILFLLGLNPITKIARWIFDNFIFSLEIFAQLAFKGKRRCKDLHVLLRLKLSFLLGL